MGKTKITGSGRYVPENIVTNKDFTVHNFYTDEQKKITVPPEIVVEKFKKITGIEERRYATKELTSSQIATVAAKLAVEDSGVDPETIDQIIFAHNYGDVVKHTIQVDAVPSLAARIKHALGIANPNCVAYDLLFGCPGWLQGMIHADSFFKAGVAKKALVIGSETLSRVIDPYDRDSMIFSDGAGATVLEYSDSEDAGVLGWASQSYTKDEAYYIYHGKSNFPDADPRIGFIKMKGRKVYEFALKHVPEAMKACLDQAKVDIQELKKVFIHQANEKMDEAILKALYKLYEIDEVPTDIMPMSIHKLGNSSVATIPTLYDLVAKGDLEGHNLNKGDIILFASVGAGMHINAMAYRV